MDMTDPIYADIPELGDLLNKLPKHIGYNNVYQYVWKTQTTGLYANYVRRLCEICEQRSWGWHFIDDKLCISFDQEEDMITAMLSLNIYN